MSDETIEQEIQRKGLVAPRVTPADIEANISHELYFTASDAAYAVVGLHSRIHRELDLLTFCVLTLKNGFTVSGESACASKQNFDAELGRKIARENAVNKLWPLMGYELKQRLSKEQQ